MLDGRAWPGLAPRPLAHQRFGTAGPAPLPQEPNRSGYGHGSNADAGLSAHIHHRCPSAHPHSARHVRFPSSSRSIRTMPPHFKTRLQMGHVGRSVDTTTTVTKPRATSHPNEAGRARSSPCLAGEARAVTQPAGAGAGAGACGGAAVIGRTRGPCVVPCGRAARSPSRMVWPRFRAGDVRRVVTAPSGRAVGGPDPRPVGVDAVAWR